MKWLLLLVMFAGVVHADTTQSGEVDDQTKGHTSAMLDKACVKGDGESCWRAGQATDDNAKARRYYEQACNKRHVRSCFELAKVLETDNDNDNRSWKAIVVICKKLINIFEPRCNTEDPYACNKLAEVYEKMTDAYRDLACQADSEYCQ